ncbi:retrovirus-related Pol polyprotein from transposon 17.6 [Trichonephila clavipes]|nr:retrovirus-related Pol polyprotein from transposon 17.6 [Trichonephila clavipes]
MKVGVCEGRVKTVAMGAQRVINPDNIGGGSFELKGDKGVANPEGLICENSCEEKYTLGTLRGCEKQLTVNREGFRIHTIAKIAGLLKGKEDTCKADGLTCLEDGLAMRLPLSEPREIYKDSLETDNQFEKRKPIICYYCNETGHIKPVCPRLRKNNFETVANLTLNTGNYDPFKKFKMNMEINGMIADVEEFVKTCDSCQRVGKPREGESTPEISADYFGASKYPEAIPVESITSPNVIDALLSIFSRIGFPREIQSDLGTFTSELTITFFNKFGIKVTRSSVSHPQSNAVERVHRTIKRVIKALCVESGEDWEGVLPLALFSLRTVAHESTGFSPTELVMGKNLRTPQTLVYEEWMEEGNTSQSVVEYILQLNNRLKRCQDIAITRMKECQLKRKTWYDRDVVERKFVEGDLVMVLVTSKQNKLEVNWIGPGERPELVSLVVEEVSDDIEGDAEIPYPDKQCTKFDYLEKLRESQLQLKLSPSQIDELKQVITKNKDVFSPDPGTIVLRQKDTNLVTGKPFRIKTCCSSQMLINSLREDTEYLLDLGVNGMGGVKPYSARCLVRRVNRYPYPRIKCIKYGNLNQVTRAEIYFFKKGKFGRKDQRGIVGDCIGFMEMVFSSFTTDELSEAHPMRYASWHVHYYKIELLTTLQYARRPVVCVPLTRQHRTARLQWCREHHNWTEQDWACVLFSDESRFSLSSDCRRQLIWRESGTAYRPENIQEKDRYPTCSIMVWASIMINGRTRLHVVANGTMTGQRYIDEVLLPHVRLFCGAVGDKFVFMDDNATFHRTLAVQDCLDSEGIQRLVWPARSPDLNPIENV